MRTHKLFTVAVASLALWLAGAEARAVTLVNETFETRTTGTLNGQGPWTPFTLFGGGGYAGINVASAYAVGGSLGAGASAASGSALALGSHFASGHLLFAFDLTRSTGVTDLALYLFDTLNGSNSITFDWDNQSGGNMSIDLEGMTPTGHGAHLTGSITQLHVSADIDLDKKTMSYAWNQVGNAGNGGSSTASWAVPYAPDRLELFVQGGTAGYDNLSLTYIPLPEPPGLALALAALTIAWVIGAPRRG